MNVRTIILAPAIVLSIISGTHAQDTRRAQLFDHQNPLPIRLSLSLQEVRKKTNDSTYIPSTLWFKDEKEGWDSIPITIRTRGNFRKKNCTYPPLRIKMKKRDTENTLFAGTKSLKLVLPCHEAKSNQGLISKEYICYQLYQPVTPYTFKTRLVDITLNETGKHAKTSQLNGFFIEDDDAAAGRYDAKVVDVKNLNPLILEDSASLRLDLFQYMISNTDFSTTFFHNIKVIRLESGKHIPIAYDFDMSGVVNAPYATVDPKWEIKNVRERVYKGYCRNEGLTQHVRQEYIRLESEILKVVDQHESLFGSGEAPKLKKYLQEFFITIKDDKSYYEQITSKCRTK